MKKIKFFLAACAAMVGLSVNAQVEPENGGVYYLYNTETGKFLTRGNSYGTQAVTNDFGHPWQVTVADGNYTLRMYDIVAAGSTSGLGSNGYSDNGTPIAFTPTGDATTGYTLVNGTNYLCSPATYGASIFATETGNTTWQFLNAEQYAAILASKTSTQEAAVATSASVDISGTSLAAVVTNTDNWRSSTIATYTPNKTDWTVTSISNRTGNVNAGTYGVEIYQGAGTLSRTLTGLAQGIYKVSVKAMYRSASNAACYTVGQAGYTNSSAYFSANGNMVQVKDWYSGCESNASPNSTSAFVTLANAGKYLSEVYCYVGSDGNLELKAVSESYWGASWFLFGDVTVTYYTNQVSDDDVTALINSIPTDKMSDAAAANIESAKTTLQNNKTVANYNALLAAIDDASTSIAEYAMIEAGTVPTDAVDGWAISTTNGALACNTWSTEGSSDGTGMTTPFIQDWVASGTALGEGSLYYTFTDLNPGETYIVTALCRVYNEAGTGVSGATFFAGSNSKSISDFGATCTGDYATKGMFATLSCAGTVDSNGQLQFGVELTDASLINWISIKSVAIAEGTGDVPTSLTMSQSSASLTTGSTLSLTATIAPETADDKTITWTSSNTAVATVSGGTVVAVGAGTATITATAYAGDNVIATCAVTVADAAAPSSYTTDLAAGDYYIMNAATGQFLGGANSWGTQASLIKHGIPFGLAVTDGVYTLDSYTYNKENEHYFSGTYVDGGSTNLYITALSNGKFSISTADGSEFVTATAGSTVVANTAADANSSFAQWYFLSKNDRDKMLAAATAENPADATYYIKQANISRNLSAGGYNVNAWNDYSVAGEQDNTNYAAQVYNAAADVYQTIEGIPNGTYTLTMQGFTSGTDVKFYAESANDAELNHVEVAVKNNDSGVGSCAGAAALFAAGQYTNTLTVTVTDRTLKIGITGDCSSAKWLCYDDFQLYMTAYTANTSVTASIADAEIEAGETSQITASTNPSTASFNAITYTSSDETVATVDENGLVTGVNIGNATITVAASEMENFSTTIDVTVTAVAPTAFTLSATEVALDAETTSATLTITPTPEGANTAATWTSSDETVATVADGVVTAVSSGTATITATSTVDTNVSASATVTVSFPESAVPEYYVNDGATRTVYTLGDNLIKNGSFEYPNNPVYGWKTIGYTTDAVASNFTITTTGGVNDGAYITTNGAGVSSDKTIRKSIPVENGKTYYFCVYTSGKAPSSSNYNYNALFKMTDATTEDGVIKAFEWPQGAEQTTSEWSKTEWVFTAESDYVGVRMGWNASSSFDNFVLAEVTATSEIGNVEYATAAIPTANIGTGAFQYSQDAIDAAKALVQGTATVEDVTNAYNAVTTINEPADGKLFNVVLTYSGWTYDQKAMTYLAGAREGEGNYNIQYQAEANTNLAQAFTFTRVSDNNYKMSQIDADGTARYICTGVPYSGNTSQIRTTTTAEDALEVTVIPTATEGVWNLKNTEANNYIGSQDAGVYTVNSHINFNIIETTKPSITINTTAAGWGTTMLPFTVASLPEGVKAFTCAEVSGNTLALVEVNALEANKPYIIEGSWYETLTGDAQGTALTYTEGLLTGTYSKIAAPNGSYILQKHGDVVGFYVVNTDSAQPSVPANRAYLTAPAGTEVKAFTFDGLVTGIQSVFDGLANGEAYDLAGRKVSKLQKGGIYIINGKKVAVK